MRLPNWTQVVVEPIDGVRWMLKRDVIIRTMDHKIWVVPSSTVVDFASSRVLRWNLLSMKATYSVAAVLHDYLYQTGKTSRRLADDYFLELLKASGVSWFMSWKAYIGVRAFGLLVWVKHRARQADMPQ